MDVEILLDTSEARPEDQERIEQRFLQWYQEGAEVRHNKKSFGSLTQIKPNHYLVDLGYVDVIEAFRDLHARLHRLGVKVFIHFHQ